MTRDSNSNPWSESGPPHWASDGGKDQYGFWLAFVVGSVAQRLRWIEPGAFLMGSPQGEAGRLANEGPRHKVRISTGFWLFDTPCTQALWEAVMKKNPSHFRKPNHPVDSVSLYDAQAFLQRLNHRLAGLSLELPSEAQWEYACRAGTNTATYVGDLDILGERHAPVLDSIAWYGGNSGVDFKLKNGEDSSGWKERQYPDSPSGTHPVRKKAPNAWGLYDMLGNVFEWCADGARRYGVVEEIDPVGSQQAETKRAARGGSWFYHAYCARAAFRNPLAPDDRGYSFGFRCARRAL